MRLLSALDAHVKHSGLPCVTVRWPGVQSSQVENQGLTAAQAMLETRGPVSTIVNPRLDHASLRLGDGALRSAGVTWL